MPGATAISVARKDLIATEVSITGVLAVAWDYGLYDYGCSYGYPNYYGYSCDTPPAY